MNTEALTNSVESLHQVLELATESSQEIQQELIQAAALETLNINQLNYMGNLVDLYV